MKMCDVKQLKPGDLIEHSRYGESKVIKLEWSINTLFGVVIQPDTESGKILLAADSGTIISRFLEGSIRRIKPVSQKNKAENAVEQPATNASGH